MSLLNSKSVQLLALFCCAMLSSCLQGGSEFDYPESEPSADIARQSATPEPASPEPASPEPATPEEPPVAAATVNEGSVWSSPIGVGGLGGIGRSVNLPDLKFDEGIPNQIATLTLSRFDLDRVAPGGNGRIIADVKVALGAAGHNFSMDWDYGTAITVPAGTVQVFARQVDADINIRVQLNASLVPGTKGGGHSPKLTQIVDLTPIVVVLDIPPRAKSVIIGAQTGNASTVQLLNDANGSFNLLQMNVAADSAMRTTGVPLIGQTQITLQDPAMDAAVLVTWLLDG